ncbi:MAG: glycosyltransferase family 39 protein [Acidobacteriota bacterium]
MSEGNRRSRTLYAVVYCAFLVLVFLTITVQQPQLLLLGGHLVTLSLFVSAFVAGDRFSTWIGLPSGTRERFCFATGLGLIPFSILPLLLGWLHLLRPVYLRALLLLALALALASGRRPLRDLLLTLRAPNWRSPVVFCIAALLILYLAHTALPAMFFDALSYHLAVPSQYLVTGRILHLPYNHGANYPMGAEFLALYGMAAGDDGALKKINFGYLIMTLVFIGSVMSDGRAGRIAQLVFLGSPLTAFLSTVEFIEMPMIFYMVFFVHAMWRSTEAERPRAYLVAAGLFAGAALSIKYIAIPFLGIAAIGWLWRARSSLRRLLPAACLAGIIALLLPSPWYVKAYLHTGNPVFPYLNSLFRSPYAEGEPSKQDDVHGYRKDASRFAIGHLAAYPFEVSTRTNRGGMLADPGVLYLALFPLLLFHPPRSRREKDLLWLSLAFFCTWWVLTGYLIRYVGLIFPLLAASIGRAADEATSDRGLLRAATAAALAAGLLFNALLYVGQMNLYFKSPTFLSGGLSEPELLSSTVTYYRAAEFADRTLPPDAKLLLVGERRYYYIRREAVVINFFSPNPLVPLLRETRDPARVAAELRRQGVTHILLNHKHLLDVADRYPVYLPPDLAVAVTGFCHTLTRLYADDYFSIYQL